MLLSSHLQCLGSFLLTAVLKLPLTGGHTQASPVSKVIVSTKKSNIVEQQQALGSRP